MQKSLVQFIPRAFTSAFLLLTSYFDRSEPIA